MSSINGSFGLISCLKNGVADYGYGFAPLAPLASNPSLGGNKTIKRCSAVLGSQCGLGGSPHEQLAWFPPLAIASRQVPQNWGTNGGFDKTK
ncbi:hypothetical protein BJP34_29395 [Moorena producens PAL-8-15-08-1]|uniref:Uncharacterized protein n=1 Tax=Moorena producens PAL-8-15-08-1 TaxID=1458985 RepID=A0A1D8TZC8_9CYAN|nr:hypothetical protein BJP34_29395 [Moorena producens PAL-8-15-08-1]